MENEKLKSSFMTRFKSSIVLTIVLVLVGIFDTEYTVFGFTLLISMIGIMEIMRVLKINKNLISILGYMGTAAIYACLFFRREDLLVFVFAAYLLLIMAFFVFTFPKYQAYQMMGLFFGLFYVSLMISYMYQIRIFTNGKYYFYMVFLTAWGNDVFAYCTGLLLGKHKAFPKLSPKKTIEGCVGGILGGALMPALYTFILGLVGVFNVNPFKVALIGACGALLAMVGDLAASAIKRNYEIKDYGKLIPGHGGILDRFDSVIFVAPVLYYLLLVLMV